MAPQDIIDTGITGILSNRIFQLQAKAVYLKSQQNGTPQGYVISPALFNIAINDLIHFKNRSTQGYMPMT